MSIKFIDNTLDHLRFGGRGNLIRILCRGSVDTGTYSRHCINEIITGGSCWVVDWCFYRANPLSGKPYLGRINWLRIGLPNNRKRTGRSKWSWLRCIDYWILDRSWGSPVTC